MDQNKMSGILPEEVYEPGEKELTMPLKVYLGLLAMVVSVFFLTLATWVVPETASVVINVSQAVMLFFVAWRHKVYKMSLYQRLYMLGAAIYVFFAVFRLVLLLFF